MRILHTPAEQHANAFGGTSKQKIQPRCKWPTDVALLGHTGIKLNQFHSSVELGRSQFA